MVLLLKQGVAGGRLLEFSVRRVPCLPASPKAPARSVARSAVAQSPNWKLDKPDRLWEGGETWYPGAEPPPYLDGTLPGDRGFDPFRLAENPALLPWMVEGELYNGRWAMMGVLGMLFVEAIGKGPWGSAPFRVEYPMAYVPLVIAGHLAYITFEYFRWVNFNKKGETGLLFFAPFDPLGLTSDRTRQSEVRNGRLAMLACLGIWSQAAVTQKGPLENLRDHIADPGHNNISTSPVGKEIMFFAITLAIIPYYLESRKDFGSDKIQQEPFRPFPFLSPNDY
ncbi:hypothetical protein WJX73_010548 [Symbiochloris irregularis]|uniref:Chlorophyll a-b binding protein, chloroplastic n=1 Tax=Symbiochloris irregularis TaxID=706552 RepID=A0AAW1PJ26_9CHLO